MLTKLQRYSRDGSRVFIHPAGSNRLLSAPVQTGVEL